MTKETYRTIETEDILKRIHTILDERGLSGEVNIKYPNRTTRFRRDGTLVPPSTKHLVTVRIEGMDVRLHDETLSPMISFFNSYNRECPLTIGVGMFRWICSNGLYVGEHFFQEKIRHRVGPTCEEKLKQLDYQIVAALDAIEDVAADVEEQTEQSIELYEQLSIVGNLNIPTKVKDKVFHMLQTGEGVRPEDNTGTVWGLYQIVNEQRRLAAVSQYAAAASDGILLEDIIALAA